VILIEQERFGHFKKSRISFIYFKLHHPMMKIIKKIHLGGINRRIGTLLNTGRVLWIF